METVSIPPISSLLLPEQWVLHKTRDVSDATTYLTELHLPSDDDVFMAFYQRRRPNPPLSAKIITQLLEKPSHTLDQDEFESIQLVMKGLPYDFDFDFISARTTEVNGKRAIAVRRRWKTAGKAACELLVDLYGDGRFVHQIIYAAPETKYEQYFDDFNIMLSSIEW